MLKRNTLPLKVAALIFSSIFALSACNSNKPQNPPAGNDAPPATSGNADATADAGAATDGGTDAPAGESGGADEKYAGEHYNYSINVLNAEKHGNTAKNELWNNKFNVSYDYIPVSWGDWAEKVRTWIATGDTPDVLRWDMKYEQSQQLKSWARQGAFKALPDYDAMKAKWPGMAAVRDRITSDELMCTVDGTLYAWDLARTPPDYVNRSNYIIIGYRRDWAKKLGLYKEGDIYTPDEMKAMIKAFVDQDPGGNGVGNTLPLVAETWCLPTSYTLMTGDPPYYKGYFVDEGTSKWTHIMFTDGYKNSLLFWNDFFQNGYMWKDQIVAGGNEGRDYFRAGRSGTFLSNWTLTGFQQHVDAMVESNVIQGAEDIGLAIMYSPLKEKEFWFNGVEDFWTVWVFNPSMDDKKLERFFDMWEWNTTEDAYNLRNYGVEGKDFEKGADGSIKLNWQQDANGNYLNPYGEAEFTEMTGPALDPDFQQLATTREDVWAEFEKMKQVLESHASEFHVNRVHDLGMYFDSEHFNEYGDFKSDLDTETINIISSSTSPGPDWDAWLETMRPKVQTVLDDLEASDVPKKNTY